MFHPRNLPDIQGCLWFCKFVIEYPTCCFGRRVWDGFPCLFATNLYSATQCKTTTQYFAVQIKHNSTSRAYIARQTRIGLIFLFEKNKIYDESRLANMSPAKCRTPPAVCPFCKICSMTADFSRRPRIFAEDINANGKPNAHTLYPPKAVGYSMHHDLYSRPISQIFPKGVYLLCSRCAVDSVRPIIYRLAFPPSRLSFSSAIASGSPLVVIFFLSLLGPSE